MTQGSNTYIASGTSGFFNYIVNPGFPSYYSASYLDVLQPSANPFVSGVTIFLTASVFYPVTPTPTETQTPTPSITATQTVTPTTTTTPTPTPTEPYFLLFEDSSIATAENNDNIEIDVI